MRGLLIIEPLYHQTVAGKKTQTRRSGGLELVNDTSQEMNGHIRSPNDWEECGVSFVHNSHGVRLEKIAFRKSETDTFVECKPRYRVGEVLYLKEPISQEGIYKFDLTETDREFLIWSNKLFMPASAARAYIRITGIKCERLLDISDEDCIAEGIEVWNGTETTTYKGWPAAHTTRTPQDSFYSLYKFANKMSQTKKIPNLWVFAYTYEYLPNYKP